eukprot:gene30839-37263_t
MHSKNTPAKKRKILLLQILIAVCLGGVGTWCMHVIGMSSLTLQRADGSNITIGYNVGISIWSLLAVLVMVTISVMIASNDPMFAKTKKEIIDAFVNRTSSMSMADAMKISHLGILKIICTQSLGRLLLGGVVAGSGVLVMHYTGVAAMEFEGTIRWRAGIVAVSVFIAIAACMAAFWILFRLLSIFPRMESLRLLSAFIMGIAVCGVHLTGMMASNYVAGQNGQDTLTMGNDVITPVQSLYGPLITAVVVLWLVNLYVLVDMRNLIAIAGLDRGGVLSTKAEISSSTALPGAQHRSSASSINASPSRSLVRKHNEVRPEVLAGSASVGTLTTVETAETRRAEAAVSDMPV